MELDFEIKFPETERLEPRAESLNALVAAINELGYTGGIVHDEPDPYKRGLSFWVITAIYLGGKFLDAATGEVVTHVLDSIKERALNWAKERHLAQNRPVAVTVYGPDGEVLTKVEIDKDGSITRTDKG